MIQLNIVQGSTAVPTCAGGIQADRAGVQPVPFDQSRAARMTVGVNGIVVVDVSKIAVAKSHLECSRAGGLQASHGSPADSRVLVVGVKADEVNRYRVGQIREHPVGDALSGVDGV